MPFTTVVGSSGSGKTTFLNDLNKHAKGVYIRQYHQIRPYVAVSSIPHFDPTRLPYWHIYEKEGTAGRIPVGGTMAGEFTPGLSGGQRKLLLFELILQRAQTQSELLIVLDEPFAGVTDDFVPWIVQRLSHLRLHHNIVLVTNDHVSTLTALADNTITVSAVHRTVVRVNSLPEVDRSQAILALAQYGADYVYPTQKSDLHFFWTVEIRNSQALLGIAAFTALLFGLFLISFWNSSTDSAALVLIAGDIIAFFAVNPYLLSLVDWRNAMTEEAEALLHSSRKTNKFLKTMLCLALILIIAFIEYGMVNAVIDGLESFNFFLGMFFDTGSTTLPFVCFGLYTTLPHQLVESLALIPFLFLIFFSTTFSPGAGVPVLKDLRYLFSRFYFWCMVPGVQDDMEGCPTNPRINMLLLCLTGMMTVLLFVVYFWTRSLWRRRRRTTQKAHTTPQQPDEDPEYQALLQELYYHDETREQPTKSSSEKLTAMRKRVVSFSEDVTDQVNC